jgi:hypothetical protein
MQLIINVKLAAINKDRLSHDKVCEQFFKEKDRLNYTDQLSSDNIDVVGKSVARIMGCKYNRVVNNTTIVLNADIFLAVGNAYIIYSQNTKNEGCVLYIGTSGNIRVLTHGGDDVIFTNVLGGTFLPVQILKVFSTGTAASGIIALW